MKEGGKKENILGSLQISSRQRSLGGSEMANKKTYNQSKSNVIEKSVVEEKVEVTKEITEVISEPTVVLDEQEAQKMEGVSMANEQIGKDESKDVLKDAVGKKGLLGDGEPTGDQDMSEQQVSAFLYSKMAEIFGGGNQLYTMEFPGRVLNKDDYMYDIKDYNGSSLNKPYAVAENEFRLSDNMVDPFPIVQGPNGKSLSSIYNTAINNLAPKITDVKDFITDKMELRLFLMQPVTDTIDGQLVTCSRMEFCQKTYLKYLQTKYNWDQEKIDTRTQYEKEDDMDGYARWLATTAWTKDHELEAMFNDAVIRGFYHEVMTILGFVDTESPAERLTKVKNSKIVSSWSSLDESRDVLPVSFQPSNWAHALKSNFNFEDLSMDSSFLKNEYLAKQKLLSDYEAELRILVTNNAKKEDIEKLEKRVEDGKKALNEQEKNSFSDYTKAQIEMVKLAFEIVSNGDIVSLIGGLAGGTVTADVFKTLTESKDFLSIFTKKDQTDASGDSLAAITDSVKNLINMTYTLYSDNLDYFKSFDELVQLKTAQAQMKTQNYDNQIAELTTKISELKKELENLATIITSSAVNEPKIAYEEQLSKSNIFPDSNEDDGINFTDIVFSSSEVKNFTSNTQNSTYGKLSGSMGNLFFNSKTEGDYSSSESQLIKNVYNSDFVVGMRVMKVTIDRGGWFDPALFDISKSFMRINKDIYISNGTSAASILADYMNNGAAAPVKQTPDGKTYCTMSADDAVKNSLKSKNGSQVILPMYPISFLIAKDFVIKANITDFKEDDYEEYKKISATTTTSLFGIRVSGGYTNESYSGHSDQQNNTTTLYIKTPGPQIIGWFSEMTSEDNASEYVSISKSKEFEEIIDALKEYQDKLNEIKTTPTTSISTNGVVI